MFNIKVFLIFSYSSVKSDAPPPLPSPTPGHFCGICWGLEPPGVCLSLAAVWGVVVWSCLISMLGCVHKHTHEHTHLYMYLFWTEPQLVSTWKCFSKVHSQYDATLTLVFVWRPRHSAFALMWHWTWARGASELWKQQVKGANNNKPAALPGPARPGPFSLIQGQMVFNLALWFSPRERRFPLWHQKW